MYGFPQRGNKCQSNKSSHLVFPNILASCHGELSPIDVRIQGHALGRDELVSASRPEVGRERCRWDLTCAPLAQVRLSSTMKTDSEEMTASEVV